MMPVIVLLAIAIIGLGILIYSAFIDETEKNKVLAKRIIELNKEVADSKEAVKFGIGMAATRIEKLSKMQPMAAMDELRAEAERNQRIKNG